MRKVLAELARFVITQRKLWIVPILLFLLVLLVLVVLTAKGGAVAPFIYPVF